ncbi:DNA helicase RecQ [Lentibacter sp. XHP0401]|uniref:DNA helicase RecQ n=1 Tax=Lentibacter sp. XHP0401 TaxID=2984334 RepID=UPI0021E85028|nr:DNA helicase RecQ [Lentibacter sp. XHP0401]MCV2893537.1 DNA helicase RecQ [Lentibacter sp. XHP0401]
MASANALLKSVFGFDAFRPGQEEIVRAVAAGENVLAIMPTGGGKSLCYQLPALMGEGLTLVISPLIALMRDQVAALQNAGVAAGALTSAASEEENDAVTRAARAGKLSLLYLAPERLSSTVTRSILRDANVARIAVDEAHCVSQWGHDFRPDYLRIGELQRYLGVPLAAFTATADKETQEEITTRLFGGTPPRSFLRGFDRPNISLAFEPKNKPRQQILAYVAARRGQCGIVYCATRAKTEALASALRDEGHNACHYHGAMDPDERRCVEHRFNTEDELIVVATIAFGMGVDKPDIRWVAHADLPKSVEGYYQEIGRAGRDGARAETLTLYGPEDIRLRRAQIDESLAPADRQEADHGRLNALLGLAEATSCRRQLLLAYFDEASEPCGNCDLCDKPPETFDATEAARMALSAILRSEERFGAGQIIDILLGKMTDKVAQFGHDALPTFGVGKAYSPVQWQAILRQLMGHDLIRPDARAHGALKVTRKAHPLLKGEETLTLRKDLITKAAANTGPKIKMLVSEEDAPLFSALKAKRRALAEAAALPAYIVFNDRTLVEMVKRRPQTLDEFAMIAGVGQKKLEKYGREFLSVLAEDAPKTHPMRRKLAGKPAGSLFDQLAEAQLQLQRGACGTQKPLSLTNSQLAKVAQTKPQSLNALERLIGDKRTERFGNTFMELMHGSA